MTQHDVRVHVPEGAVPKDGPSAGLAIAAAMLSALTGRPLRPRVALTGEITLSGRVLRVGGLKEKLLAATRSGVRAVVLPEANRASVAEIPAETLGRLDIHYVREFAEAVPLVIAGRRPRASRRRSSARRRHGPARSASPGTLTSSVGHGDKEHPVNDEHDHQTPGSSLEPGVDAGSGRLEPHCSQCGSLIEGSHEFCQVCALEASGGELPPETRRRD